MGGTIVDLNTIKFDSQPGGFVPLGSVKFDQPQQVEAPFMARNPNTYALLRTAADFIPYAKYIDPSERERFNKLATNEQTRELLLEDLSAVAMLALPAVGKAVASVVSPIVERFLPKTYKLMTKEINFGGKTPAPKVETPTEPVSAPVEAQPTIRPIEEIKFDSPAPIAEKPEIVPVESIKFDVAEPAPAKIVEPGATSGATAPLKLPAKPKATVSAYEESPLYAALDEIKQNGGINIESFKKDYGDAQVLELVRKRPGILSKTGEAKLDEIAQSHGFEDGDTLLQDILGAKSKRQLAKEEKRDFDAVYGEDIKLAKKGFEKTPDGVVAGDLAKGDKLFIDDEVYKVKGEDKSGNLIIQDGKTLKVDAFDKIPTQGIKKKTQVIPENVEPEVTPQDLEVLVKGGRIGGLDKYAEGSAINLERLDTTQDVKQFIQTLTKSAEKDIGKHVQTWDQTRAKAEELGWDISAMKKAFDRKGSFTAAEIEATRQVNLNAVNNLFEKIRTLPADRSGYTPELRAQILDTMDSVRVTSQAASEAGRSLNIHRKALANDPSFTDISAKQKMLKAIMGKGTKKTDDIIDALRQVDTSNPADVNRFIYNVTKTPWQKLSDRAYELWLNGLLSHPLSHMANVTSNALTLAYTVPERVVAAGTEATRAAITKTPRQIYFKEGAEDIFSIAGGLQSGWKRFLDVMKRGDVGKFDKPMSALPENVAKYMPTRALSAEDAFFKGFIEHSELNRLAFRQARNEGLKGEALSNRIQELATTPTREMLERVAERGKYLTYQKELGEVGKWVMRGRETPGPLGFALKIFIPFIKTPTNIAKFALERTPLNFPVIVAKAVRGELKGSQISEELAKPLLGTALATTAYILAEQGMITGGMPKKKSEREEKMNTGFQPYSFKPGDTYYSFGRMEPLGSILGLAADFNQMEKDMTKEEQYNVAAGIMGAIKNNISNKTFMQGFSNMIELVSDPGRYGKNVAKSLAGSTVPAVVAGVERSVDPYIRDAQSVLDAVKARVPGVAETLPQKLTIWGDPVQRAGTAAGRFISPVQTSTEKGSPVEKEMVRLDLNIGLPSRKLKGVELPETEYWDMVRSSGTRAKETLNKLIERPGWEDVPDKIKEKIIKSVVDQFRNADRDILEAKYMKQGKIKVGLLK